MAVEAVSGNGSEAVAPAPAKEVSAKAEVEAKEAVAVSKNASFREESNFLDDLKESERKALAELRDKVEAAIAEGKLFDDGKPEEKEAAAKKKTEVAVEKKEEEVKKEAGAEEEKEQEEKKDADVAEAVEKKEKGDEKETAAEEKNKEEGKEEAKKEEAGDGEKAEEGKKPAAVVVDKDIALWGVPLLPSKGDEATDVVLLKFLRARDFKAGAAFEMLRSTLRWRRDWKGFAGEDGTADDGALPEELESACYLDGADREGHPVCYNALGVFADDAVYKKALGTDEGKARFLRWRVRAMERHVAELVFKPGGATSLLQVTDLRNSPGPAKKDLRVAMKQVLDVFQDNYPELVARNILINVPFWYYAFSTLFYPFMTQRTKSKFVIARPSKVTETLLKYIPIEAIPVKYGGLKRDGDTEFSADDGEITELIIKASSTETIEIEATEVLCQIHEPNI
uniref:CRAL-TRIO domain-containing protein n=1 Tax=Arundo donax TaxID=35708 RepID=A0A0A8YLC0_ARUDO